MDNSLSGTTPLPEPNGILKRRTRRGCNAPSKDIYTQCQDIYRHRTIALARLLPIQEVYSAPSQATALSEVFQCHGVNCMGLLAFFTTRTEVELRASRKIRKLVTFPQVCADYVGGANAMA